MMKDIDFWTCPPRGTELDILWKAYLTSEDGFVLKLIHGDKSGHALTLYREEPVLIQEPLPSSTTEFVTPLRLPWQLDAVAFHT